MNLSDNKREKSLKRKELSVKWNKTNGAKTKTKTSTHNQMLMLYWTIINFLTGIKIKMALFAFLRKDWTTLLLINYKYYFFLIYFMDSFLLSFQIRLVQIWQNTIFPFSLKPGFIIVENLMINCNSKRKIFDLFLKLLAGSSDVI